MSMSQSFRKLHDILIFFGSKLEPFEDALLILQYYLLATIF